MHSSLKTIIMKEEVNAAVKFIAKLIKRNGSINDEELLNFQHYLKLFLIQKFVDHWHPEKPWLGQGYRCLRVNGVNRKEATIDKAASKCGLNYSDLNLPLELTVWVDPEEVCCRFGEHKGSYCTIAAFGKKNETNLNDIDIKELSKLEVANDNKKKPSNNETSKSVSSPQRSSSIKENIAPERIPPQISNSFFNSSQNIDKLKTLYENNHPMNKENCRVFAGNAAFVFNEYQARNSYPGNCKELSMYNPTENISPPCYKTSSWIGYPTSLSPTHPYMPAAYFDYSPTHFSSQENLNLNRLSPIHINKLRWSSGLFNSNNAFPRNGWVMNRHLARV